MPALSTATPYGLVEPRVAARAIGAAGAARQPASVVTTPAGVILRIVLLPVSATYTLPALSTATPSGWANRAALPVPSALPELPGQPCQGGDHAAGRHLPNRGVHSVRHVHVARAVHRHTGWIVETARRCPGRRRSRS